MDVARVILEEIVVHADATNVQPIQDAKESTPLIEKSIIPVEFQPSQGHLDGKMTLAELEAVQADLQIPFREVVMDEVKALFRLSIPMSGTIVFGVLAGMFVGIMNGNVSKTNSAMILAAIGLSDTLFAQFSTNILAGVINAVDTVSAQSVGAKQYRQLWLYLQAGALASAYCLPVVLAVSVASTPLFKLLGQDAELAALAGTINQLTMLSLPFLVITLLAKCALLAQSDVTPILTSSIASYVVSILLGYVLGYWTPLGYVGLNLSETVNSAVHAALLCRAVFKNPAMVDSWPGWQFAEAHTVMLKRRRLAVSCILMLMCQNFGPNTVTFLSGMLPNATVALSASSISSLMLALTLVPIAGMYAIGAVRVGTALGAGKARRAKIASQVVVVSSIIASAFGMVFLAVVAKPFANVYTTDPEVAEYATWLTIVLLPLVLASGAVSGFQTVYHGCARQLLSAKINAVSMIFIGAVSSVILVKVFDAGIAGLWYGQIFGMVCFCAVSAVWMHHLDWSKVAQEAYHNAHLETRPTTEKVFETL